MQLIEILIFSFYGYLMIGLLFGFLFVFKGVQKVDDGMKEVKWILRLMILPASMALWPFMLRKFLKA